MLVLSRRLGQGILIGDDIEVTVAHLSNNTVRIGINAPSDVSIVRQELDGTQEIVTVGESEVEQV
jgi:carbon storage regulator